MQSSEVRLKQIMSDVFNVDVNTIDETASVDTIEGWDSLKHLNLVLALEEAFAVTLTEEQTVEILSYPLIKLTLQEHRVSFD